MTARSHLELHSVFHEFPGAVGGALRVLDGISFQLGRGSFVSIVGPSGCGKSTLLNIIGGFLQPTGGLVTLNGQPVHCPQPGTVVIFQESGLFPWRTALENAAYGLELAGVRAKTAKRRARAFLQLVGLTQFESFYPAQLSGGMKQRVALARALAVEPQVILLDEPFGALDVLTRIRLQLELERIWRTFGTTILLVTHDIEEAVLLSDRILVLDEVPARIHLSVPVPLDRPRCRYSVPFTDVCRSVHEALQFEQAAGSEAVRSFA